MAEFGTNDWFFAVRAATSGDLAAKITSLVGWEDISEEVKGNVSFSDTIANTVLEPAGGRDRGRRIPGAKTATMSVRMVAIDDADGTDGPALMRGYAASSPPRFQFIAQPRRSAITSSGAVTLAASASNPQFQGSAFIESIDYYGPGGDATAICQVTAGCDSDYTVFES